MFITEECISCNACVDECEHNAIYDPGSPYNVNGETHDAVSDDHTYIAPELCDDCKTCIELCPVDAIVENPN